MYKVKFPLSESSAVRIFLTLAVTPDEDPVILVPTSWSTYVSTGIPKKSLSIWTHVKLLS